MREVAGVEGVSRVRVPFSLSDLSQIEKKLGFYTSNPFTYIKEFQYLTQSYNLTFHDLHVILSSTLLAEERRRVWEQARTYANDIHLTTPTHPIGTEAVPDRNPNWDYNDPHDIIKRDQLTTCLVAGLRRGAHKAINYEKLQEIIQHKHENPSVFLGWLTTALLQYTNLDPETPDEKQLPMIYFFSQSFPDIKAKLKRLERRPLTPQAEVLAVAFKVYNGRDEKALKQKYQQKYQLMVKAFPSMATKTVTPTTNQSLPGPCFKCSKTGHWARAYPNPQKPSRPCPKCHLPGHWRIDCPSAQRGTGPASSYTADTTLLSLVAKD